MTDHECAGCGECFTGLPVVDTEDWLSRRYCTDECMERASERHWTAVWAS